MKWFGRSLLHLILLLLAVSLVSFLLVSMSPVDPLQTNVGQTALGSMAPEQIEKLQAYWGVGVPVWKRFFSWISGICHGDFGISLLYRRPVLEVIAEKASASVWLLLSAWLFSAATHARPCRGRCCRGFFGSGSYLAVGRAGQCSHFRK